MNNNPSSTLDELMHPLKTILEENPHSRDCPSLSDTEWLSLGVKRVIGEKNSGRSFLQSQTAQGEVPIWTSHYFDALKSERRLNHLEYTNKSLINSDHAWENCEDHIATECPELEKFVINIGDGHHTEAPVHEERIGGSVYSTQNFYAKNLRNGMMWQLTLAEYGDTRKKEHDMRALKRQDIEALRAGALKGQKSLWIWDRACMSFLQWHKWKMKGIYFLTMEKELNEFKVVRCHEFDKKDSMNAGVISDEEVESGTKGILLRRIKYRCPDGKTYSYITNLHKSIRPGAVAFLYKCRWDIEKVYNTFKHKFHEQKAWAVSRISKNAQANFICLTHNLCLILNRKVDKNAPEPMLSPNYAAKEKQEKRIEKLKKKCKENGQMVPQLLLSWSRLTEMPKKFLIWLRETIRDGSSWAEAMRRLEICCARRY